MRNGGAAHIIYKGIILLLSLVKHFLLSQVTRLALRAGYKGLCGYRFPITFYNLYNLVTCDDRKCFTAEISRIMPFIAIVSRET